MQRIQLLETRDDPISPLCPTTEKDFAHSADDNLTNHVETVVDLDKLGELEGYVLDPELGHAETRHFKTSSDGRTISPLNLAMIPTIR
jgi:hypothetical protein